MSVNTSRVSTATKIKKMAVIGLFCALAYASIFVFKIEVPPIPLRFDIKDSLITICGLIFGPVSSLVGSLIIAIIEIPASTTGFYGFLMNFISSAAFSCTAALVYKYRRDIWGAVIGLVSAVCTMTVTMVLFNLVITPVFMKVSTEMVAGMIPTLFLPFNATKAVFNAALVLFLYKPVSTALKAAKIIKTEGEEEKTFSLRGVILSALIGATLIAISVVVFVMLLDGTISWF